MLATFAELADAWPLTPHNDATLIVKGGNAGVPAASKERHPARSTGTLTSSFTRSHEIAFDHIGVDAGTISSTRACAMAGILRPNRAACAARTRTKSRPDYQSGSSWQACSCWRFC
jgi:hypothetical protein